MHRIIESYLKKFSNDNSIESEEISKQFEYFVNYCIAYDKYPGNFDFKELTTDDVDGGIDGIIFMVDNELVTTIDEIKEVFSTAKRDCVVEIIFIQSKSSESYDKGEILKFGAGVNDFISQNPVFPQGEFLTDAKIIFDFIIENVAKVKNGRPDCFIYYVCTSNNEIAVDIEATQTIIKNQIDASALFNSVKFSYIGLTELMKLWENTKAITSAVLSVEGFVPYPIMSGVTEAYVAIVSVKEFIEKILLTTDNKIKPHIFEENVRAFLGNDNTVNTKIRGTLNDLNQCDKFAIFNNGITIISPDVKFQGKKISLENYQIVNGCQTSNILFECKDEDIDSAYVTVKIIEVTDNDVIADIVNATNSQSKVENNQFLAFDPFIRRLEKYFDSTQDVSGKEIKFYFERRLGQYKSTDIPKKKIFSITEIGRVVGALFLLKPDLASRYPNKFIAEMAQTIFDEKNKEASFYLAALVDYKLRPYYQKKKKLYEYAKYKWHIITIFGFLASGTLPASLQNKKQIEKYKISIIEACFNEVALENIIDRIPLILVEIGLKNNRDEVRSAAYAKQVLEYCTKNLLKP